MKHFFFFISVIILAFIIFLSCNRKDERLSARPNVILILVDDLGLRYLHCYGNDLVEPPDLDRLANEGIRFTNAYASCTVCSPTRASLLTGKKKYC